MKPSRRIAIRRLGALLRHSASATALMATLTARSQADDPVRPGRTLVFPRDHGAHLGSRIEWWYVTGWLASSATAREPEMGFQVTFFRLRTGLAQGLRGRFAPHHLLLAHAAVTELGGPQARHRHAQRLARWSGEDGTPLSAHARTDHAALQLGDWWLRQPMPHAPDGPWRTQVQVQGLGLTLNLQPSQTLLLQGQSGFSRKGPQPQQASHYYSLPQMIASAELAPDAVAPRSLQGRAWLDHEWSDQLLHPQAVGWDWVGLNLDDGSALTVFQLRRADGTALWAGGSLRRTGTAQVQDFAPTQVRFEPGARWRSPATGAEYPVEWRITCPAGRVRVRALLDAQELDSRASTGTAYWEGLSQALDERGQRIGLGYLEMTGYAGRLLL